MCRIQENEVSRKCQIVLDFEIIYVFVENCHVPKYKLSSKGFADLYIYERERIAFCYGELVCMLITILDPWSTAIFYFQTWKKNTNQL